MPPFIHAALFYGGAATLAAPIVIHLIFRMRKRRIVFSSLRFLHQSMLKESRRLKLRELILLLLRVLACVLIAAAFGRPYFTTGAMSGTGGHIAQDIVLVLDDSPSMAAVDGGSARWREALDKARKELDDCKAGDRAALVLVSDPGRAEIELNGNFETLATALKNDRPSAKRGDLTLAMNTAVDLLVDSKQLRRRVIVISDFQSNAVDRGAWATLAQKAATMGSGVAIELKGPASTEKNPVRLSNLAITDVRAKSDVWIKDRKVPFAVRIANYGEEDRKNLTVKLFVDGKEVDSRLLGLGPRSSTEVELGASFQNAGDVEGRVQIDAADCFPDDDKRFFALRLRESVKVLVIDDSLDQDKFTQQSYFLRKALRPEVQKEAENPLVPNSTGHGGAGEDLEKLIVQVEAKDLANVTPDTYHNCDLVILCGVTEMSDQKLKDLEKAVRDGKNLIVFTGRADGKLSASFYNGAFWNSGLGLLPARPGSLYEGNVREIKFDSIDFININLNHPLFKIFAGKSEKSLGLPRFYRHYKVDPADLKLGSDEKTLPAAADPKVPSKARPAGTVLANFAGDGGPFALERPYGKGTVLMFPFVPTREATDLPIHKSFAPLVQEAVAWLSGVQSASRRSLIAGDNIDFGEAGVLQEAEITLKKPASPDGKNEKGSEKVKSSDYVVADVLGIYSATFVKKVQETSLWAANLDPRESELVSESQASLKPIFSSTASAGDAQAAKIAAKQLSDEQKALAPEWRWCLLAALCCLILEVALRDFWKS